MKCSDKNSTPGLEAQSAGNHGSFERNNLLPVSNLKHRKPQELCLAEVPADAQMCLRSKT